MKTTQDRGSFSRGIIHLRGSFVINGTSNPTVWRDGKSALIKSVVRNSAGLFTVTFNDYGNLPAKLITERAALSPAATGTATLANVVNSSYSQSARTVQIVTSAAGAAADPATGLRVSFELSGSTSSAGTDAA